MNIATSLADTDSWHDFFIAAAGGAAALSGLIFVAVSINLREILKLEAKVHSSYLTGRALESLASLLLVLAVSLVGLDPRITILELGAFLLFAAGGTAISPIRATRAYRQSKVKPVAFNLRFALAATLFAAYAVAGITLFIGTGGGLEWLIPAFLLAVAIAASNAWVLLVEVLR